MHKYKKLIPDGEYDMSHNSKIKTNSSFGGKNMNAQSNKLTINKIKATENFERTKILLENYRDIVWTMNFFSCNTDVSTDMQSLWGIIQAFPEVESLIQALNQTVKQIRYKPDYGEYLYEIIDKAYIAERKSTSDEICEDMYISQSNLYRKKKFAIKLISERIWDSSHKDIDAWRKFVEALDDKRQQKEDS